MGNLSVCPSIVIFHIFNFIEVFSRPSKAFFLYHGVRRRTNVWVFVVVKTAIYMKQCNIYAKAILLPHWQHIKNKS